MDKEEHFIRIKGVNPQEDGWHRYKYRYRYRNGYSYKWYRNIDDVDDIDI